MKKFSVLFVFLAFSAAVTAHPPTDIRIETDLAKSTVKVTIDHQVQNPAEHYIREIELKAAGKNAVKQETVTQTSDKTQEIIYTIPGMKAGDKIEITGDCSMYGDLTKQFSVAEAPAKKAKEDKAPKKVK